MGDRRGRDRARRDATAYCRFLWSIHQRGPLWGEALRQRWEQSADKSHWPPDWEASANGDEMAEEFGRSEQGFSLFPFNTNAIHALAETFCRDDRNELKFNPRQIINQILLRVLQHCRRDADEGRFPPPHLGDVAAPAGFEAGCSVRASPTPSVLNPWSRCGVIPPIPMALWQALCRLKLPAVSV